jgi:hypothetical protein
MCQAEANALERLHEILQEIAAERRAILKEKHRMAKLEDEIKRLRGKLPPELRGRG